MMPPGNIVPSDAAKRCADIVNLHFLGKGDGAIGQWVAIRLSDGGSDGQLYDKRADAVRHQLHETQCAYVCIPLGGMTAVEAESFLNWNRKLYDGGMRMTDPDKEFIQPLIPGHLPFGGIVR